MSEIESFEREEKTKENYEGTFSATQLVTFFIFYLIFKYCIFH